MSFLCASIAHSEAQVYAPSEGPQSLWQWNQKLQEFKISHFQSRVELYDFSKHLLNQLEDSEVLSLSEKKNLRQKISSIESNHSDRLPELKLVGFKKTPVNPANLKEGFILEPEYR